MMAAGVVPAAASFVTFPLLVLIPICTLVSSLAVPVLQLLQPCLQYKWWPWWEVSTMCLYPHKSWPRQCCWQYPHPAQIPCFLLTAAWLSRRARSLHQGPRHGLSPGAWELRALEFVAFPLTVSSTQLLLRLDEADSPLAGFLLSIVLLCFLLNQAASTWGFVRDVLRDGPVVRTALPQVCVGDPSVSYASSVFVDKICDELSSMNDELISGTNILGDHIPVDEDAKFVLALEN